MKLATPLPRGVRPGPRRSWSASTSLLLSYEAVAGRQGTDGGVGPVWSAAPASAGRTWLDPQSPRPLAVFSSMRRVRASTRVVPLVVGAVAVAATVRGGATAGPEATGRRPPRHPAKAPPLLRRPEQQARPRHSPTTRAPLALACTGHAAFRQVPLRGHSRRSDGGNGVYDTSGARGR